MHVACSVFLHDDQRDQARASSQQLQHDLGPQRLPDRALHGSASQHEHGLNREQARAKHDSLGQAWAGSWS